VTTFRSALLAFVLAAALGVIVSAQRLPEAWARSLYLIPTREAWVATDWIPGSWKVCAAVDRDGELRGCTSIAELREKAAKERRAVKAEEP
jgi:hypothetical protein